jgi:hypothetical protein
VEWGDSAEATIVDAVPTLAVTVGESEGCKRICLLANYAFRLFLFCRASSRLPGSQADKMAQKQMVMLMILTCCFYLAKRPKRNSV